MKLTHIIKSAAVGALMFGTGTAFAAGTLAGTDISNSATVDFTVGGINQPDVPSNVDTFETDRRILFSVAESGTTDTIVAPGQVNRVLTFLVTNSTNGLQDFRLQAIDFASAVAGPHGGTDNFNPANVRVFVDSNNNGTYESGTDTGVFLDEFAVDTTVAVFIVADIPIARVNTDLAALHLQAIAADPGVAATLGADATQTAGAENPLTVDTVFADTAGTATGDAVRDGRHSDDDAYFVSTAAITVTKTSTVISDPFNGGTNPKRIPGAVVEYCLVVANTGGSAADLVVITDVLTAQPVTFVAGSIFSGGTAACTGGTAEDDNAVDPDETDPNGGSFSAGTVTATVPSVGAGTSTSGRFRVTIN